MVAVPIITGNGKELPATWELVSVEVVHELNRIPTAQLIFADGEIPKSEFPALDSDALQPGAAIEIKVRVDDKVTPLFKGLVARVRLDYANNGPRVAVECKDKAFRLTKPRRSTIFPESTDADAFATILGRAKLAAGDLGGGEKQLTLVQYDASDWDFIVSRAESSGRGVVVKDGKLSVLPLAVSGSAALAVELGIDEVGDFELELDAESQHPDVTAIGWDLPQRKVTDAAAAKKVEPAQGNVDPAKVGRDLGLADAVLRHLVPISGGELKAWASARLAQDRLAMFRGRLSIGGTGEIDPLNLIELKGFGARFNGKALVTGIRHTIEGNQWSTDLRLGLAAEPFTRTADIVAPPAQGLLPAARGLSIGIVSEYKDDPDGEFRVRVTLPGVSGGEDKVWARLIAPEAGSGRGFFFRPDPGDEVVLGFLAEDPRQPVVLGALFGSKNKPPKPFADVSKDNIAKGLVTKHGIALDLTDKDGKAIIHLKTPKGTLTINDDKGEIELSDGHKNSLVLSKKGVTIKSGKDFKLEASGKVELKGASINAN